MDWKKTAIKLLYPPVWLMAVLTLISAAALTAVFLLRMEQTPVAYGVYVLAFYTLSVVTAFCVKVLPRQLGYIKQRLYDNPQVTRFLTDTEYRGKLSLYLSLGISLAYVAVNLLSWYFARSWWFAVLAVYYVIMAVLRYLLAGYVRKNAIGSSFTSEWKRARTCACVLLLVNLSLSGAVLMILYRNKGYDYPGILIYVMAMYTFYSIISAVMEMVKNRRMESPVMTAAHVVSLSAALVSLLNLETAMFAQFGQDMAPEHQRMFIILTGAGVSVAVVTLSVLLIVKATKEIRGE